MEFSISSRERKANEQDFFLCPFAQHLFSVFFYFHGPHKEDPNHSFYVKCPKWFEGRKPTIHHGFLDIYQQVRPIYHRLWYFVGPNCKIQIVNPHQKAKNGKGAKFVNLIYHLL